MTSGDLIEDNQTCACLHFMGFPRNVIACLHRMRPLKFPKKMDLWRMFGIPVFV